MRFFTQKDEQGSGTMAAPPQEPAGGIRQHCPAAMDSPPKKVELASLFPGGQTKQRRIHQKGSGNSSSPEPVSGCGVMKGTREDYRFVPRVGVPVDEL